MPGATSERAISRLIWFFFKTATKLVNSGDRDRNKTPLELTWWLWNDGVCCCYPIANRKQSAQRAIVQPTISPVVNTLLIIDRRDHEPAIIRNFLVFLSHLLLASRPVAAALKGQLGKSGPTPSKDARLLWRRQPRFLSLSDCPPRREFRCRIKRFQLAHNCCRLYTIRNSFFSLPPSSSHSTAILSSLPHTYLVVRLMFAFRCVRLD